MTDSNIYVTNWSDDTATYLTFDAAAETALSDAQAALNGANGIAGTHEFIMEATDLPASMEGVKLSLTDFVAVGNTTYADIQYSDLWDQDLPSKTLTFTKTV